MKKLLNAPVAVRLAMLFWIMLGVLFIVVAPLKLVVLVLGVLLTATSTSVITNWWLEH